LGSYPPKADIGSNPAPATKKETATVKCDCLFFIPLKPKENLAPTGHWHNLQSVVAICIFKKVFTAAGKDKNDTQKLVLYYRALITFVYLTYCLYSYHMIKSTAMFEKQLFKAADKLRKNIDAA